MDASTNGDNEAIKSNNVSFRFDTDAAGDVIFLPTDVAGTPGILNSEVLLRLGLGVFLIPTAVDLGGGYTFVKSGNKQFCFVVTVGDGRAATLLRKNLRAALLDRRISNAKSFWIPLMGTGTGGLTFSRSQKIILEALKATGWLNRSDVAITIAAPPSSSPEAETIDQSEDVGSSSATIESPVGSQTTHETSSDQPPALSAGVIAALKFASALRSGRRQPGGPISTTLLLFALAESQTEAAPRELTQDRSASLFSGAVHALAGDANFRRAWELYFSPDFILQGALPLPDSSGQTPNVRRVLTEAAANKTGNFVEVDDLVRALLRYPLGQHNSSIHEMGLSSDELLSEYVDALVGQIGKTLLNDVAADIDRLGYESFATAVRDFLTDAATPPPLSISIQAPWGAGKSSLMNQIRNKLDPKSERDKNRIFTQATNGTPKNYRLKLRDVLSFLDQKISTPANQIAEPGHLWTVWFNAWKYDTSEQLWAGLVDAIISQVSERLKPSDRELFLLRLQLARIDDGIVRRKIYDRVVTIWWSQVRTWFMTGVTTVAALFGLHRATANALPDSVLVALLAWSPTVPIMFLALYLLKKFGETQKKTENEPASFSLAEYLTIPNYDQALGSIHQIHDDLLRVLSLTPVQTQGGLPSPIVVFIDDLDRCSPSKIASVVEGVCMFLASEHYRCMFVIGIDPQMIAAALEEAHAKVREQLPRYERTVPLGWRFMDKFIQLPFTIPPSNKDNLEIYVNWLSGKEAKVVSEIFEATAASPTSDEDPLTTSTGTGAGEVVSAENVEPPAAGPISEAVRQFKESRDVGFIIQSAALGITGSSTNPREIKRIANIARLYLGLRNARRLRDPSWRSPSLPQYARWISVTLKWPDMMRWLQWGADEGTWTAAQISASLTERRLQLLQDRANAEKTPTAWAESLASILNVPASKESDWACDPKLFEFFQAEARLPVHERLSTAAARGFW